MRVNTVFLMMFVLSGCGSPTKDSPLMDMPEPIDASVRASPDLSPRIDFSIAPCTAPQPGIYIENVSYTYNTNVGPMNALSSSTPIVRNSGQIDRSQPIVDSTRFHCSFSSFDPLTCLAPCCPGEATSPSVYVDRGGWTTWSPGMCSFSTASGAQYTATIMYVDSVFSR